MIFTLPRQLNHIEWYNVLQWRNAYWTTNVTSLIQCNFWKPNPLKTIYLSKLNRKFSPKCAFCISFHLWKPETSENWTHFLVPRVFGFQKLHCIWYLMSLGQALSWTKLNFGPKMAPQGGPQKGSKIQLCQIFTKFGAKYRLVMKTNIE